MFVYFSPFRFIFIPSRLENIYESRDIVMFMRVFVITIILCFEVGYRKVLSS